MFERLFDIIEKIYSSLIPFVIIDCYEKALVLRLGKFHRELGPGFHLTIPFFGYEKVIRDNIIPRVINLDTQSLTTVDNKKIIFSAVVTCSIHNLEKALLEIEHVDDAIKDSCLGVIGETIRVSTWEEISKSDFNETLRELCHKLSMKFGIKIHRLQITDLVQANSYRIFSGNYKMSLDE